MKKNMKFISFMILIAMVFFIYGCESGTTIDTSQNGVVRELPSSVNAGETFTVKLHFNLNEDQDYYLAEENVPKEFEAVNPDFVDKNNVIKIIKLQDAESTVIEYDVIAPQTKGTYAFSGQYSLDGMEGIEDILGNMEIIVN